MKKRTLSAVLTATLFLSAAQPAQADWNIFGWLFWPSKDALIQKKEAVFQEIQSIYVNLVNINSDIETRQNHLKFDLENLKTRHDNLTKRLFNNARQGNQVEECNFELNENNLAQKISEARKKLPAIKKRLTKLRESLRKYLPQKEYEALKKELTQQETFLTSVPKSLEDAEKINNQKIKPLEKETDTTFAEIAKKEIELKIKRAKDGLGQNDQEQKQRLEQAAKAFWYEGFRRKKPDVSPKFLTPSWSRQKEWRRQNAKKTAFLYSILSGTGAWASIKYLRPYFAKATKGRRNLRLLSYSVYALPIISAVMFKKIFDWQAPSIENGQVTAQMIRNNYDGSELQRILESGPEETLYQNLYQN